MEVINLQQTNETPRAVKGFSRSATICSHVVNRTRSTFKLWWMCLLQINLNNARHYSATCFGNFRTKLVLLFAKYHVTYPSVSPRVQICILTVQYSTKIKIDYFQLRKKLTYSRWIVYLFHTWFCSQISWKIIVGLNECSATFLTPWRLILAAGVPRIASPRVLPTWSISASTIWELNAKKLFATRRQWQYLKH